ncbi:MAG: hypothetical protein ABIJ20_03905 [Nanoarchaeota archaeon]
MNDALLWILGIMGLGALYWVLFGEKLNKKMLENEDNKSRNK